MSVYRITYGEMYEVEANSIDEALERSENMSASDCWLEEIEVIEEDE